LITDNLGLLDSTSQVSAAARTQTDNLGLLDSSTANVGAAVSITDNLGPHRFDLNRHRHLGA
jgi:hypothetical protein